MADVIGTASIKILADGSDFPKSLAKLGGSIEKSAQAAGEGAGKALTEGVSKATGSSMKGVVNSIGTSLSGVVGSATKAGQGAGDALSTGIVGGANRAAAGATDALGEISGGAARAGQVAADAMDEGLGRIPADAASAAQGASDELGAGMAGAGAKASAALQKTLHFAAIAGKEATKAVASVTTTLVSGLAKAGKKAGDAVSNTMKKTMSIGLKGVAGAAAGVLGGMAAGGAKRLTSIDQASKKLEALGNDTAEVAKIMDAATAAVTGTAFGLDEAATSASMLAAAGVKTEDMEQSLRNIASTASIAGGSMADLTPIFTDAAAAGKITGDTLMRMEAQGIAASQMMADDMGISVQELKKQVSEGNISFEEFSSTMENTLGPAAEIAGQSFLGMAKNIGAAMGRVGAIVLGPAFESLKGIMPDVIDMFDRLGAVMKPIVEKHTPAIEAAFERLGGLIQSVDFKGGGKAAFDPSGIKNAMAAIQRVVRTALLSIVEKAPAIIAKLVPALATAIVSNVSFILEAMATIVTALAESLTLALPVLVQAFIALVPQLAQAFLTGLPLLIQALADIVTQLAAAMPTFIPILIENAMLLFGGILQGLLANLPALIEGVIALLLSVVQALLGQLPVLLEGAIQLFIALVQAVFEILPELLNAIVTLIPQIITTLMSLIPVLLEGALQLFMAIVEAIPLILPPLLNALISLGPQMIMSIISMLPQIITAAVKLFMGIVKAIPQIISSLIKALKDLWPVMKAQMEAMGPKMLQAGKDIIKGLVQGIKDMVSTVVDTIKELGNKVIDGFKNLFGISSPSRIFDGFGKDIIQGLINGIKGMVDKAVNAVKDLGNKVMNKFKGIFGISSPSKVFKGYGHNIIQGLVNGLEGSASEAENSIERIVAKILDSSGLANKSTLVRYVETQGAILVNLLKKQDKVLDNIKDQQKVLDEMQKESASMAAGIQSSLVGEFDISKGVKKKPGAGSSVSFDTIAGNLSSVASQVTKFAGKISELLKKGYPNSIVQQVASLGTEKGIAVADALLSATKTQQGDFLKDWDILNKSGGKAGKSLADDMFKVGIDAQAGLVKGLLSEEKKLDAAAKKLATTLTKYVKKHLGVKSPSKVFESIGHSLGDGLIKGLKAMELPVAKAMTAMTGIGSGARPLAAPRVTSLASSDAGGSTSVGAGGDTYNVNVEVSMDDISQLKDFGEFIKMLRVRTRMGTSGGSGV